MAKVVFGNEHRNVRMVSNFFENGKLVFYIRPFSEEVRIELEILKFTKLMKNAQTLLTEKNGTYQFEYTGKIKEFDFMNSMWGILFRKFLAESKTVCVDPITDEKYYKIIFSEKFIEPCERKVVA